MKNLFKTGIIAVFAILLFVTGCGQKNVEGTLEEIMTKVYKDIPQDERPMGLANTVVTEETVEYFLGTKDIEYEEALASEPMVSSIAHSVVLVRTKKNANVEEIKRKIKENVNPRKWMCVEADEVVVKSKGNLIILIMVQGDREKLETNFDNL